MSTDPQGSDRRLYKRVRISLLVKLRFGSVDHLLHAHSFDLSRGGMFLKGLQSNAAGVRREIGQRLDLEFEAEGESIIQGEARIVRVTEDGVGVEFVDLDEMNAQLIDAIVKRQLGRAEPSVEDE